MRSFKILPVLISLLWSGGPAAADEGPFLQSLAGTWSGKGTVIMKIGRQPINVSCSLSSTAQAASVVMKGTCRGLLVVTRRISAELNAGSAGYSGIYIGPSGGQSALSGTRRGNAIDLSVRWGKDVNGDRTARMIIQLVGADGLRLRTIDKDLSTGKEVATCDIVLQRN
ncbi:hypothetical protein [Mycoplana dimorpha]|uniref:DUF1579 domain-containing protein n=1 Tax=Mycoplana dimorpha TaxID=28320 RepID=A0A2T5BJ65_MYCDI|nr:hypothetical protein [Mycoplana dimorpha]PTM99031.1 hypothetical protein C7449_101702 [Mycoplana dimorpha]